LFKTNDNEETQSTGNLSIPYKGSYQRKYSFFIAVGFNRRTISKLRDDFSQNRHAMHVFNKNPISDFLDGF
jgi:hypothetical protein